MDLVSYIVKTATETGIEHVKKNANDEVEKVSKTIKVSVTEGITNAIELSMPLVKKNGFYLIGSAFLLFGVARLIDTISKYDGTGFVVVGILTLLIGLVIRERRKI